MRLNDLCDLYFKNPLSTFVTSKRKSTLEEKELMFEEWEEKSAC